jgi:hypothetical protein
MKSKRTKRKRGVVLSIQGWQKLQAAIAESELRDNYGEKYTVQQLGSQAGLDSATISKVLDREKSVDRRTIERFFRVFGLNLENQDYNKQFSEVQVENGFLSSVNTDVLEPPVLRNAALPVHSLQWVAEQKQESADSTDNALHGIDFPGSPLAWDSSVYVERPEIETLAYQAIIKPGALIRIKSPEKWGKTSLVYRILAHGRSHHYQTIRLNIQQAEGEILGNLDRFLRWLCANVATQLNLESRLDDYWNPDLGSKISCTAYFQGFILPQVENALVLALDEIHRVFEFPQVAQDFLSMLRVWHEEGKNLPSWKKLRQIVIYATEVYIPLDLNQSPFNVGLPLRLPKFELEQAKDFALRYGLGLFKGDFGLSELVCLHEMVDGHPYLLHLAFSHMAHQKMTVQQLFEQASTPTGIYGDHLRRHLNTLQKHPDLAAAFKAVLTADGDVQLGAVPAYKLESMGLVKLQEDTATPGCDLYRFYFRESLNQF